MFRKFILIAIIPFVVILIYSYIFKIDLIAVLSTIESRLTLYFITFYIISNLIFAFRDSRIANSRFITAIKARFLGNAFSLILPGWSGAELARALVYSSKEKMEFVRAFSYSLVFGFYDVLVGTSLFLILSIFYYESFLIIFIIYSIINIGVWISSFTYLYLSGQKLNKFEKFIFERIRIINNLSGLYVLSKNTIREGLSTTRISEYISISIIGYMIQSLSFLTIANMPFATFLNQLYLVALLVPTPSGAGAREILLSLYLKPEVVLQVIVLETICYALGFIFIGEIDIKELKNQLRNIFRNGNFSQS